MTTTPWFAAPSTDRCPACGGPVEAGGCGWCGIGLDGPWASALWQIDVDLHRLCSQRASVVALLQRDAAARRETEGRQSAGPPAQATSMPSRAGHGAWVASGAPSAGPGLRPQHVLLGLGALCLAVAGVVFAAVSWDRLAAWAQAGVLVAATAALVAMAVLAAGRRLRATAEALAVAGTVFAVVDVHVARVATEGRLPGAVAWAVGLTVVAAGTWVLGRRAVLTAPRVLAVGLAQVPAVLVTWQLAGWSPAWLASALLVQAAVLGGLVSTGRPAGPSPVRAVASAAALAQWLVVASTAPLVLAFSGGEGAESAAWTGVSLGAAGLAAAVALRWRAVGVASALAGAAAVTVTVATVDGLVVAVSPASPWWLAGGAAAVTVLAVSWRRPGRWSAGPVVAASALAVAHAVPILPALAEVVTGLLGGLAEPWTAPASAEATTWLGAGAVPGDRGLVLAAELALVWAVVAARWTRTCRVPRAAAAASAVATVACLGLLVPWSIAVVTLTTLMAVAVAAAVAVRRREAAPVAWTIAAGALGLAAGWGAAWPAGTVLVAAAVAAGGAAVAVTSLRLGRDESAPAAAAALVALVATSWWACLALGWGEVVAWPLALSVAIAASAAAPALRAWGRSVLTGRDERAAVPDRVAWAVDLAAGAGVTVAAVGVAAVSGPGAASLALLSISAGLALHSLREDRPEAIWVAATVAVLVAWLRLDMAQVTAVEAYTLSAAGVLLAAGWFHREAGRSSWVWAGPGLAVALLPSVVVAGADTGLARSLVLGVAATVVVMAGARSRLQAPVAIGGVALALVAVEQLGPVVAALPRALVFALLGGALIGVGATFERRRREAAGTWARFRSLH